MPHLPYLVNPTGVTGAAASLPQFTLAGSQGLNPLAPAATISDSRLGMVSQLQGQGQPLGGPGHAKEGPAILADVPEKIWLKLVNLEYVEMADLLPESWSMHRLQEEQGLAQCCHSSRSVRRGPVTNLLHWLEGYTILVVIISSVYTILVAIISSVYSAATPAYQRRIIWAASTFEGSAWVTYDSCYRRRAACLRSLGWSVEDT